MYVKRHRVRDGTVVVIRFFVEARAHIHLSFGECLSAYVTVFVSYTQ